MIERLLADVLTGARPAVGVGPAGQVLRTPPRAVLCGSFNPLHAGHRGLAAAAAVVAGADVAFELSAANVDKPDLAVEEVLRRVSQFAGWGEVWVTRAAGFAAKAELFPGAAFVVGFDTAVRIIDGKYYGGSDARRDAALAKLLANGHRVIVGGRADATGAFREWTAAGPADAFRGLFVTLPGFRADVSSTELRSGLKKQGGGGAGEQGR